MIDAGGRIVSLYVGTRKRLWLAGAARNAVMVQDVLTDPEFRGRGFLNRFATSFFDEIHRWRSLGYTFPNKLSENSFRRSGWVELCRIPIIARPLTAGAGFPRSTQISFHEVDAFTAEIDEIWQQAGLPIGVLRDSAYLGWRYGRPDTTYRRFKIGDGAGYLVLKLYSRGDQRIMHVCDLVLRKAARPMLPTILSEILALASESGAALLTAWVTVGHPYRTAYDTAGFRPDESNDRFAFVTGPKAELGLLATAAAWHLSQGDSDVY